MNQKFVTSIFVALVFGVQNYFFVAWLWGYIPNINPITTWLLDNLTGSSFYYPLVYIHDLLLSIILAVPLACLILILSPKRPLLYLCLALLPSFVSSNMVWVGNEFFNNNWATIAPGWLMELGCVPIAYLLLSRLLTRNDRA